MPGERGGEAAGNAVRKIFFNCSINIMITCAREYHRAAEEVVCEAKEEGVAVIVLEKLKGIRGRMNYSKQMNGRLPPVELQETAECG
ncbi:MAG: hypothetical protein KIH08_04190 [Candidatus Freyarchaeota archaeon]|nr:hypothetical protein [Candidatus Jordarchaeia archaeon]MBS7267886.1 hypothetical protein [Candidatus Jordarchaeia archaeon]